jgi:hypothetical protein
MDIVGASLHAKEILVDITDSVNETREPSKQKTIAYGPDGELLTDLDDEEPELLGKWDWTRVYYDAFMTVALPTFDVITDWASLVSIAVTGLGGLFYNDCQLLQFVGNFWLAAVITILIATINGTLLWCCGLYLFSRRWPEVSGVPLRVKLRIALEGLASDQSTRFLCRREGEKSRFRWAHCHQLATLLLEDLPSLIATLFILVTIGGSIITLVSFCVSVFSFSKHISSYISLAVACCCRSCSCCSRRAVVISRYACCTMFCVAIAISFVFSPFFTILGPISTPQLMPVRSWSVRIPAIGVAHRFVPRADVGDLRTLKGGGYVLFGSADGVADVRLERNVVARSGDVTPFVDLYGGNFSTLAFDDALVFNIFNSLGGILLNERYTSAHQAAVSLWRRGCVGLPTIAVGAFQPAEQQCVVDNWPENCTMSSIRLEPPGDFVPFNATENRFDVRALFNKDIRLGEFLSDKPACAMPCFRDSLFCAGFGSRDRMQLAYAEIDIQFGQSEQLCLN